MIKYWADLLEKLTAGAFVIGIFQPGGGIWAIFGGLILIGFWYKLRLEQIRKEAPK